MARLIIFWGMNFFLTFRFCMVFLVGNSLCKNGFKVKHRTWLVKSTCSIFPDVCAVQKNFFGTS